MSKFTVYVDRQNEFRWKFAANDGAVVAKSSQGYRAKDDCVSALGLLQKEIAGATVDHEVRSPASPAAAATAPASAPGQKPVVPASLLAGTPDAAPAKGTVAQN